MFDEVLLYTDGASRGNPGPAAAGFRILTAAGESLFEHEEALGVRTNNQAEYAALNLGLDACRVYTAGRVAVGSDSKLLVEQMNGTWKVREPELQVLARRLGPRRPSSVGWNIVTTPARMLRLPKWIGRSTDFWMQRRHGVRRTPLSNPQMQPTGRGGPALRAGATLLRGQAAEALISAGA